ncbi:CaiB/BaiF CoA-transferase family protein [Rhodococcus sp. IEGM 1379]|uniref:CaiB/BaiF CoA transferase family protein n=1 Tax=Rhodococcus sp. IEGM 1379 TaxID=3047086 RepID=UPI0024B641DF|nr:CaiB/BaiF CoA-transferase family protein [Rhodococcus sp. IEGM 1379]MDI9915368.1 CaiB/BaiF CoA-transferase family protein [Rhodococcus sp. IEGM 1379]
MTEPLSDLVVVDFSELLPGPFLTQNLAELGARVIKIERPGGDPARTMSPGIFAAVNRDKEHLTVDLKDTSRRPEIEALLDSADIVIEGFRPGVMAKLGFGPREVLARYPRIIYVSMSGYGQDGPEAKLPGHDNNYAARAGVLALAGKDPRIPDWLPGIPMADLSASMYALSSLLAAVHARERSGQGCYLDVSIRDCLAHWLNPRLGSFYDAGINTVDEQRAHVQLRPAYGTFECSDGIMITIAALEEHFWSRLVKVLDLAEWSGPEWSTYREREEESERINAAIAAVVATQSSAAVTELLVAAEVPVASVLSPFEALAASPNQSGAASESSDSTFFAYPVKFGVVV